MESAANPLVTCVTPPAAANEIPVHFNVPTELNGYTGRIPFTFGVPFEEGELDEDVFVGLYQMQGQSKCAQSTHVTVTARWFDTSGPTGVKWLLIDGMADMEAGVIQPVFLHYDNALPEAAPQLFDWSTGFAASVATSGEAPSTLDTDVVGRFRLRLSSGGDDFMALQETDPLVVEHTGAARTVLKQTGNYVRDNQGDTQRVGQFITRYTLFEDQPFMRVYHTMIWGRDSVAAPAPELWGQPADELGFEYDVEDLEFLTYDVPGLDSAPCNSVTVGLNETSDITNSPCADLRIRQLNETTLDQGAPLPPTATGKLAGWMSTNIATTAPHDVFVGLRWAYEQFPSAFQFAASGGPSGEVRLLEPLGASWESLSVNDDTAAIFPLVGDPPEPVFGENQGPLGVAKTYELWLWPSTGTGPSPAEKNAFAQGKIFAYADPAFVVRAEIPSPMSPLASAPAPKEAVVEQAIADSFDWAISERAPGAPDVGQSRLGALHFGDAFYDIVHEDNCCNLSAQRYWQHTGTGFQVLPWMLWMRSGDPGYRDFADANARHVMDVDTGHVNRRIYLGGGLGHRKKGKGWQSGFQRAYHGAFEYSVFDTAFAHKQSESEGIALAYFLTGYERAHDVLVERGESLAEVWQASPCSHLDRLLVEVTTPDPSCPTADPYGFSTTPIGESYKQGPQNQYRTLAELAILHEAVGEQMPELEEAGTAFLDAILALQDLPSSGTSDGWLPGARIAWREHGLVVAGRAFPGNKIATRNALSRLAEYDGSLNVPGVTGKVGGAPSTMAALARFEKTGDERALLQGQAVVYAQALTLHDDASTTGGGDVWTGSGRRAANDIGPRTRDWLAVLAQQRNGYAFDPPAPALPYLSRAVGQAGDKDRFYVLKDAGEELYLPIDFNYRDLGLSRRTVDVATTGPSGSLLDTRTYCTQTRQFRFLEDVVGVVDPDSGVCSNPSGTFVHPIAGTATDLAGVFRVELTHSTPFPVPAPSVRAIGVTEVPNQFLSFDGLSDHHVQIATGPRLQGRSKMTLAFRLWTEASSTQTVFTQPYQYAIYTHSGKVWAYFNYVKSGSSLIPIVVGIDMPTPWTDLNAFVATLDWDPKTGDAIASICSAPDTCVETVGSYPGYELYNPSPGLPFTIGRYHSAQYHFSGDLDDLRILPRIVSDTEIADYFVGNGMWTLSTADYTHDGEAFLFDGDLEPVSGDSYTWLNGTEGLDFDFGALAAPTRIGRPRELVQYDGGHDDRPYDDSGAGETYCCTVPATGLNCIARAPSFQGAGALFGRSEQTSLQLCHGQLSLAPARFGFLDANSELLEHAEVNAETPASTSCVQRTAVAETPQTVFLAADFYSHSSQLSGLSPLVARSPDLWFDALSCEDNYSVGDFGTTGTLDLPGFSMSDDRTVSFKFKAPHTSGPVTILNKQYEFLAFTYYGQLNISNYITGGSGAVVSAPYPEDEWVTVTTTASYDAGNITAQLYLNGILVDERVVSATGFNSAPAFPLSLGGGVTGYGTFDGLLDDVWFEDGIASSAKIAASWYVCQTDRPGALAFESFEACPPPVGTGTFSVVDRLTGAVSSCPHYTQTCLAP